MRHEVLGIRARKLKVLGYQTYSEYLNSEHWKNFRSKFLTLVDYVCTACGADTLKLYLHHLHYSTLGKEEFTDVRLLCATCHEEVHKFYGTQFHRFSLNDSTDIVSNRRQKQKVKIVKLEKHGRPESYRRSSGGN